MRWLGGPLAERGHSRATARTEGNSASTLTSTHPLFCTHSQHCQKQGNLKVTPQGARATLPNAKAPAVCHCQCACVSLTRCTLSIVVHAGRHLLVRSVCVCVVEGPMQTRRSESSTVAARADVHLAYLPASSCALNSPICTLNALRPDPRSARASTTSHNAPTTQQLALHAVNNGNCCLHTHAACERFFIQAVQVFESSMMCFTTKTFRPLQEDFPAQAVVGAKQACLQTSL